VSAPLHLVPATRGGPAQLELEPLLTAAEVARLLGVRPKRVYELGIPAVRISERSLRWARPDVAAWIAERKGTA
jgi:predicted DNA-binding transcriptional regulator AlpA